MSKLPSPPFQMGSWARWLGGHMSCCSRGNCIFFFQFSFRYFVIVFIWPMYHEYDERFFSFLSKRAASCSKYEFFSLNFHIFCLISVIVNRITNMYSKYFDGELLPGRLSWFINSIFYMLQPIRSGFLKSSF